MEAMDDLGDDDVELARVTALDGYCTAWAGRGGDEVGARRRSSVDGLLPGLRACVGVSSDKANVGSKAARTSPTSRLPM